jgi:hypothetical protein
VTHKTSSSLAALTHGKHQCVGIDPSAAFVEGLVKLVAKLKNLRPATGEMGLVKTIMVDSEKVYLNDSWSYLGPYASSKSPFLFLTRRMLIGVVCSVEGPFRWEREGHFQG